MADVTQYDRWRAEIQKTLEANIGDAVKRSARLHDYDTYDCQIVVSFRSPRLAAIFNCGWAETGEGVWTEYDPDDPNDPANS